MKKYLLCGLLVIAGAIFIAQQYLTPKAAAQKPLPPIQSFSFSYSGTVRYPFQDYQLKQDGGKITLILDETNDYARQEHVVTQKELDALHALLDKHNVQSWNGFSGSNPNVLDGYSFSMYITFQDNTSLRASGSNSFPKGFGETKQGLIDFFEKYRVKEKAK